MTVNTYHLYIFYFIHYLTHISPLVDTTSFSHMNYNSSNPVLVYPCLSNYPTSIPTIIHNSLQYTTTFDHTSLIKWSYSIPIVRTPFVYTQFIYIHHITFPFINIYPFTTHSHPHSFPIDTHITPNHQTTLILHRQFIYTFNTS